MIRGCNLKRIAEVLQVPTSHPDLVMQGVCVDTRLAQAGDLFFACIGQRVDGHDFLKEAAQRGVKAVVVSKNYQGPSFGLALLHVDSPEKALQDLAKHLLSFSSAKVIGITGSVGKTTSKEFVAHLLRSQFRVAATRGNYNSQLGLPLSILNDVKGDEDFIVLEMGMTRAGEITHLVQIAPPFIALLLGASLVHAENFSSLEEIVSAKAEILSHPKTTLGIVNHDLKIKCSCPLISFADENEKANATLIERKEGLCLLRDGAQPLWIDHLPIPGKHNRHNFLGACVVALYCGVSKDNIQRASKTLSLPKGRLDLIKKNGITLIDDAYNASPISMKAALESLPVSGRKIAVFGAMLELGNLSDQCHREVGEHSLKYVDELFCLGKECLSLCEPWEKANRHYFWSEDLTELIQRLRAVIQPGDTILVKGSRSTGISKVIREI